MSNTQHLRAPFVPKGDMGIGLCLPCLGEVIGEQRPHPEFAISFAPMQWPPGGPLFLAVPACFEHVKQAADSVTKPGLLVAAGGLAR